MSTIDNDGFALNNEELLYDAEPAFEDTPGMSRVQELENALDKIIDLWDKDLLVANATEGPTEEVFEAMEKAYLVLAQPEEE